MTKTDLSRYDPPCNIDAEQSVIGSMLISKTAIEQVYDLLKSFEFYRDIHVTMYTVMCDMFASGRSVDLVTVQAELESRSLMPKSESWHYMCSLIDKVPFVARVQDYAIIVKEQYVLRSLEIAARNMISVIHNRANYDSAQEVMAEAEAAIDLIYVSAAPQGRRREGLSSIGKRVWDKVNSGVNSFGMTMGFRAFDRHTSGYQKGDLVVIAARPNVGKTALALKICDHIALECNGNALIFEAEMPSDAMYERLLCSRAKISKRLFRNKLLTGGSLQTAKDVAKQLYNDRIQVVDVSRGVITPSVVRTECRSMQREQGLDLVVIDYLELVDADKRFENETNRIDYIIRQLKQIAVEFECVVIVLAQLSRAVDGRDDKRPVVSDIRQSGGIEAACDWAWGMYNESHYRRKEAGKDDPQFAYKPQEVEILNLKTRNDAAVNFKVGFIPVYTHFYDLVTEEGGTGF